MFPRSKHGGEGGSFDTSIIHHSSFIKLFLFYSFLSYSLPFASGSLSSRTVSNRTLGPPRISRRSANRTSVARLRTTTIKLPLSRVIESISPVRKRASTQYLFSCQWAYPVCFVSVCGVRIILHPKENILKRNEPNDINRNISKQKSSRGSFNTKHEHLYPENVKQGLHQYFQ